MGNRPDLPCQAHFTDGGQIVGDGRVPVGRSHRQHHRQVRPGLIQPQAADDIDIGVKCPHPQPRPLLRHSQKKHHAVEVEAVGGPPWHIGHGLGDQRLNLRQHGAGALHDAGHAGAAGALRPAVQKHLGRVRNLLQAAFHHFKYADLIGRAKPVLGGPQKTVRGIGVALKIQHAVHHVLQNLWPRDIAVLVDVAHHEHRNALGFAQLHHGHGAVLHLRDAAGRGFIFLPVEGLDGVDHENIRLQFLHSLQNVRKPGLGENVQGFRGDSQPLGPELQLPLAFLAGDIEHAAPGTETVADLQQQRGFADAGRAAHQNQ